MGKIYEYEVGVDWKEQRKGIMYADGKPPVEVATPPEFKGHKGIWTPEDLLVAAVCSCMMTTFLYYVNMKKLSLRSYKSKAKGFLEIRRGFIGFTHIDLYVEVSIANKEEYTKCEELLKTSKADCLISRAIKPEVHLEYNITVE